MIGNKEPSTALVRMLLDLWIGLHVHLAACSDATKAVHPLLLALVLPTLSFFSQPNTHRKFYVNRKGRPRKEKATC